MGCERRAAVAFVPEMEETDFKRGRDLLRQGRNQEALTAFLRVVETRAAGAPESHLEAGILYQQHLRDPIAAIYHYKKFRELSPGSAQDDLVRQRIAAATRDFARTLPGQPLENQSDRTDLLEVIERLQRENLILKDQLVAMRHALLEAGRPGGGVVDFGAVAPVETAPPARAIQPGAPGPSPVVANVQPAMPVGGGAVAPAAARRHVVVQGDTLYSLSQRYYGDRSRWREIYAANRDVLPSENALRIGMELRIP